MTLIEGSRLYVATERITGRTGDQGAYFEISLES